MCRDEAGKQTLVKFLSLLTSQVCHVLLKALTARACIWVDVEVALQGTISVHTKETHSGIPHWHLAVCCHYGGIE